MFGLLRVAAYIIVGMTINEILARLTARRVNKGPDGLDLPALFDRIET